MLLGEDGDTSGCEEFMRTEMFCQLLARSSKNVLFLDGLIFSLFRIFSLFFLTFIRLFLKPVQWQGD